MSIFTIGMRLREEFKDGTADLTRQPPVANVPVPSEDVASLARSVRALKSAVDVLSGTGGSVLDKAMTVRDMIQQGALAYTPSGGLSATGTITSSTGGGSGGGGGGGYVDPRPIYSTPPTPTALTAQGAFKNIIVSWTLPSYQNHAYTEVWRNTSDNLGTATLIASSVANNYSDASGTLGSTYYYWVRAVNFENVTGAYNATAGVSAGLLRIGTTDLGSLVVDAAALASGAVTATKLAANAVDQTKVASGLELVTIVSSVPGTLSTKTIFNTGDSKLYRWNGSAYIASVPTTDLSGTITDAQIAGMAASKVTGTLSDAQLAAISAAKVTGQITTTQITDNAISTAKLAAGAVTANEIAANTITAAKIAGGTITATEIAGGTITGAKIAAGTIAASNIAANTITAGQIAANTITSSQIAADTITAGNIAAGAIGVSELAAGAVTTDKLVVTGRGAALNDDPNCQDQSAWTGWSGNPVATVTAITDGKTGNSVLRASTSSRSISSRLIPADPSRTYRLSAWVRQSATGNGLLYLRTVDYAPTDFAAGGIERTYSLEAISPPAGVWTQYKATITVPAGRTNVTPHILLAWGGSVGYMEAQDVRLEEMAGADLIVDGAIVANKLAANSIAVGTAAIENGAINNAMIANLAVDDAKIANGTITDAKIANLNASKITAGYLDAARIAAASITAGMIDSRGLSIKDGTGTIILAAGTPLPAGYMQWANIDGSGKPQDNATVGAAFGVNITGQITSGNASTYIAAAAIGSAQVGTLTAGNIGAGTIDASKISVSNLQAVSATIGTLRTASSGARTELIDNAYKVYDASNVKRVQIGDLTL